MEFLPQQNKVNQGDSIPDQILATGKHVIVIGGGDTGSDCTGTSNRQRCASLTQFELLPQPPDVGPFPRAAQRPAATPWPNWPLIMRTSTSHEEGCQRQFGILTKEFLGDESGQVQSLITVDIEWTTDASGRQQFKEIAGSERKLACPARAAGHGFRRPREARADRAARARARCPRQRQVQRTIS